MADNIMVGSVALESPFCNQLDDDRDVARVKREHTKSEIDRAAATMLLWWKEAGEDTGIDLKTWKHCYDVIKNWRMSHAYPLNSFRTTLRARAEKVNPSAIVVQRMKRFTTLMNKLEREPSMKLSQMQDLGGCRSIVETMDHVNQIYGRYRSQETKCYDYIRNLKEDGYRGIHLIGRYQPQRCSGKPWENQRIEIQIRTQLQHAFATTVETVTTFTREQLKFGGGHQDWRRFFSLIGSAFAYKEGTPLIPNTPHDQSLLRRELHDITKQLDVINCLQVWRQALSSALKVVKSYAEKKVNAQWLLLVLDVPNRTSTIQGYQRFKDAQKGLEAAENDERSQEGEVDVVLVHASRATDIRVAYPNYFADTRKFIRQLTSVLRRHK